MISKETFLQRVAQRLGRGTPLTENPGWQPSKPLPSPGPTDVDALVERFELELQKLQGKSYRVASEAEIAPTVAKILADAAAEGFVVRWEDPLLEGLNLDETLKAAGYGVVPFTADNVGRELVNKAEEAVAGITGVDCAIAETGTLVMASSQLHKPGAPGRGRTVSLLPPIHIAIVRKHQMVYSPVHVFQHLAKGPMPSQVAFASGPSRSADIENDLSIGVHGPKQVHVIIV